MQALPNRLCSLAVVVVLAGATMTASAQTPITHSTTYASLSSTGDWQGGVVPGSSNIALWNSTSGTPSAEALGANLVWEGIQIVNPGGPVTVNFDGNSLTNGAIGAVGLIGINMTNASQNLTLNNNLVVNGVQDWNVASGQTLNVLGPITYTPGSAVRINLADSTANVYVTNGNPNQLLGNAANLTNGYFATLNDTDMVGLVSGGPGLQVVGGSTISGLYTVNPGTGATPTMNGNFAVANFTTNATGTYGWRTSGSYTWGVAYFNQQQSDAASTVSYKGVTYTTWQIIHSSGRNITIGTVLDTTNVGNSAVWDNGGGLTVFGAGGPAGANDDMRIIQNNTAAPYIMANTLHVATGTGNLIKMGPGLVSLQAASGNSALFSTFENYEGTFEVDSGGSFSNMTVSVYGGNLALGAPNTVNSGNSPITIFSGATNSIILNAINAQDVNTNMTFDAGSTLEFVYSNGVAPSTTTAPLAVAGLNSVLTLNSTVNLPVVCASLSVGTFPLVSYVTLGGAGVSALNLELPPHVFGYISNDTTHALIDLVVTNYDQPIAWNTTSGTWDIGQTANWKDAVGNTTTYQQLLGLGDNIVFNDGAPGPGSIIVTLNTNPTPSSVLVSNANNTYTISGSGTIGGLGTLTKNGSGTLTLGTVNTFTGGININNGTVIFSTLNNLGAGAIGFGGGTLQYNGNTDDISTHTVALNAGGATINTAGQSVSYTNTIGNNGAGGLTKTGSGTLTLNGTNTYSGSTVVNQGTLALGPNTYLTNSSAIVVNSGTVLDAATSGIGLNLSSKVSQTLSGIGQVNGAVSAPVFTTVSPAGSGVTGTLTINGSYSTSGGTNLIDVATHSNDVIAVTGTGNLTLNSGTIVVNPIGSVADGRYVIMTYSGSLSGSGVTVRYPAGIQSYSLDTSVSGQIALVVLTTASDNITWAGNGSTWDVAGTLDWSNNVNHLSWAYTNGDTVTFNDFANGGNVSPQLTTGVTPSSVIVSNTVVSTYTLGGGGLISGNASLTKAGTGTLILETPNNYSGVTVIQGGTLQVGNGSSNGGIGDIGSGNVTNNGALVFEQGDSGTHTVAGSITGTGSLAENATATVVLGSSNSYSGPTTITAGTLQVGIGTGTATLGSNPSVTDNGTLVLDDSNSFSFPYNISGSGQFADTGPANISLGGTLTYQGNTYISNGVVKVNANNQIPNENNVGGSTGWLILDGNAGTSAGTLDMSGFNLTVNSLSGVNGNAVGTITNSSTSTTTTNILTLLGTATTTYNGQIMDSGAAGAKTELFVTCTGTNTLTLNPSNICTYSAGLIVSNATLVLGTPGGAAAINPYENQYAVGLGPITLLGTNTVVYTDGGQPGASEQPNGNGNIYAPLTNTITIPGTTNNVTIYGPDRGYINSTLLGGGVLNYNGIYVRDIIGGDWSAFTGQIIMSDSTVDTAPTIAFTNAVLPTFTGLPDASVLMTTDVVLFCQVPGANFPIGALSGGDQTCYILGTSESGNSKGADVSYDIGGLNTSTTYNGGIGDSNSLVKVGSGSFTLDSGGVYTTNIVSDGFNTVTNIGYGTNYITYMGSTTVSNGTLVLVAPVTLTNSTNVVISAPNAVLDASAMGYISNLANPLPDGQVQSIITNSIFEVVLGHSLSGIGTLNGILQADPGSTFSPGLPTGAFNVTSNASLSGTVTINLDNTNGPACGELVTPAITASAVTLIVTNLGPGLTNGTTYTLFSKPVPLSGFSSITLPNTDPTGGTNYMWQTNLAVNGSITLTNGGIVAVTIPPTLSAALSHGTLTLSWPVSYEGYILQVQTNLLSKGLSTNWVNVPNSASVDTLNFTVVPTNPAVFFRLIQ